MLRKTTSLTALLSFILILLSSVILYIVPAGRIAYWSDWRLWGLSKTEWTSLHVNLGLLFVLSIILHTVYNWKSILGYLRNRAKQFRLFTREFNLALLVVAIFTLGTYTTLPPFAAINSLSVAIKDDAARFYGEPPYGHAELTALNTFVKKTELDLELSLARLEEAGIVLVGIEQPLKEIAANNGVSAQQIYSIMSPPGERATRGLPKEPPAGLGKLPLSRLCKDYGLETRAVLDVLADHGLAAEAGMNIKTIAAKAGKDPFSVYEFIREGLK